MFHWEIEFPEVFLAKDGSLRSDGGFDAVVGNPPYIRIQSLDRELAQWCRDRYETAFGSFDAYIVFIERAVGLLGSEGHLGFIVPNKFLKLDSGQKLRERLAGARLVAEIVDFGDAQLFQGATNYTSVLILDGAGREEFTYRRVRSAWPGVPTPREIDGDGSQRFVAAELGKGPWILVGANEQKILRLVHEEAISLGDASRQIFQGLITSADPVYILRDLGRRSDGQHVYSAALEEELVVEPDLLRPIAGGAEVERFAFRQLGSLLLFPYKLDEGGTRLVTATELANLPKTDAYLRANEPRLRGRESGKMDHDEWYGYVYPKSLGLHEHPKLGVPRLCDHLHASIDPDGEVYLDNVDVNGVLPKEGGPGVWTLGVLLNSVLLDFVFRLISVPFRGSFYSANKQFIAPLPIRVPDGDDIAVLGKTLFAEYTQLLGERAGFLAWLEDLIGGRIEDLAGRKKLERPDSLARGQLQEVLTRNRQKLSVDPTSRSFRDRLSVEHATFLDTVAEIERRIGRSQAEADAAVFDLYGLTAAQRDFIADAGDR